MIGQYTRIFMVVTMMTLTITHVSKASCKVGEKVIEVNKSYKSPPPDCKVYRCKEGDILTSNSICVLWSVEGVDCCKYGSENYTKLVYGCECINVRCKEPPQWYQFWVYPTNNCS